MGDTEELRRRVESDPASIAFATLAEEYRRAGRFDEAVDTSRAGLRFHPMYVSARVTLGRSLMELGEHRQAERELRLVLKSSPDNLAARRALGDLYWRQADPGKALEQFQSALTLAPGDHELADIVQSLQREVSGRHVEAGAASPAMSEHVGAAPVDGHARPGTGPVRYALEKFYRAIVAAREARASGQESTDRRD
jgi:tetratricopeptide (TPR) repeat protein